MNKLNKDRLHRTVCFCFFEVYETPEEQFNLKIKKLKEEKAWIQVLHEDWNEIYSYQKPFKVKNHYTPIELIHAYKYSLADTKPTNLSKYKRFVFKA